MSETEKKAVDDFICDKCNKGINIEEFELYDLYCDEDIQHINCPHCKEQISIEISKKYSFRTMEDWEL